MFIRVHPRSIVRFFLRVFTQPSHQTYMPQIQLDPLIQRVLAAVYEVSNTLGTGFLEKVYERALLRELSLRGIQAVPQAACPVLYKGAPVGEYYADILVEDVLILELKCVDHLAIQHTAQCLNYLRASGRTLALLINFNKPTVELKRVVYRHPSSSELIRVP